MYYIKDIVNNIIDIEMENKINTKEDLSYHYDMVELTMLWYDADTMDRCKYVISEMKKYDIFLGEFIKSIIKINNMINEISMACDSIQDIDFMNKLQIIPKKILKFIVSEQSLYV
tara:strand:- start:320 stop:664 length:345 start_codon:yes stop_codon:yes gene_type:complete